MRIIWFLPLTILIAGAGIVLRLRRRREEPQLTTDPVSGQWLAEARGREEHPW
jgi:cytochrome c-type biogenesis protein CcmH/NrfF